MAKPKIDNIITDLQNFYTKARYYYNGILTDLASAEKKRRAISETINLDSVGTNVDELAAGISAYINTLDTISNAKKFSDDDKKTFEACKKALNKAIEDTKNSINLIYLEASEKGIKPDEKSILREVKELYKNFLTQDTLVKTKINEVANNNGKEILTTIAKLCGNDSTYITDLEKLASDDTDTFTNISKEIASLRKIVTTLNTFAENSEWEKVTPELLNDLQADLTAVTTEGLRLSAGQEKTNKIANKATKYDWPQLFNDVTENGTITIDDNTYDEASLWDLYYETEWGENAEKIKNLGRAFVQELLALGFSANINPFVAFLQDNQAILDLLQIETYNALHNSYLKRILLEKDLRGTGDLGEDNLIFNPNLYSYRGYQIENYLDLQYKVWQKIAGDKKLENDQIAHFYNNNRIKLMQDLFYKGGNPLTNTSAKNKELKSIEDIKSLFVNCFGDIASKNKFNLEAIEGTIKNANAARALMSYLIIRYCDKEADRRKYTNEYKLNDVAINLSQLTNWGIIFDNIGITASELPGVLKEIAEVAKIGTVA